MSVLPMSSTRKAQEDISAYLNEVISRLAPGSDIVLKAWQTDIASKVTKSLAALGTFVFVDACSYVPLEKMAGAAKVARMVITVRQSGALKSADNTEPQGWDAEDLAAVLVEHLDGMRLDTGARIYDEVRVTSYKPSIMGLQKGIELTIEFNLPNQK